MQKKWTKGKYTCILQKVHVCFTVYTVKTVYFVDPLISVNVTQQGILFPLLVTTKMAVVAL